MFILVNHEVNSLIVPPSDLINIPFDEENEMCMHPRLSPQDDSDVNISAYYSILCISPIAMEDFLIVICLFLLLTKLQVL